MHVKRRNLNDDSHENWKRLLKNKIKHSFEVKK